MLARWSVVIFSTRTIKWRKTLDCRSWTRSTYYKQLRLKIMRVTARLEIRRDKKLFTKQIQFLSAYWFLFCLYFKSDSIRVLFSSQLYKKILKSIWLKHECQIEIFISSKFINQNIQKGQGMRQENRKEKTAFESACTGFVEKPKKIDVKLKYSNRR